MRATYYKVRDYYVVQDYIGTFCKVINLEACPTLMAAMRPAYSGCTKSKEETRP